MVASLIRCQYLFYTGQPNNPSGTSIRVIVHGSRLMYVTFCKPRYREVDLRVFAELLLDEARTWHIKMYLIFPSRAQREMS